MVQSDVASHRYDGPSATATFFKSAFRFKGLRKAKSSYLSDEKLATQYPPQMPPMPELQPSPAVRPLQHKPSARGDLFKKFGSSLKFFFRPKVEHTKPLEKNFVPHAAAVARSESRSAMQDRDKAMVAPEDCEKMNWASYIKAYANGLIRTSSPHHPATVPKGYEGYLKGTVVVPANDKDRVAALRSYAIIPYEGDPTVAVQSDDSDNSAPPSPTSSRGLQPPLGAKSPTTSVSSAKKKSKQSLTKFQQIVTACRREFAAKTVLISLVDEKKLFFKCELGLGVPTAGRDVAFCGHTILSHEPMVVPDMTQDWRMCGNPLVTGPASFRAYAGAPIITSDGYAIGTVCVLDTKPRHDYGPKEVARLVEYAAMVMDEIEQSRADREAQLQNEMKENLDAFHGKSSPVVGRPNRLGALNGASVVARREEGSQEDMHLPSPIHSDDGSGRALLSPGHTAAPGSVSAPASPKESKKPMQPPQLACHFIAKTLRLDFVYILHLLTEVRPVSSDQEGKKQRVKTHVLASVGMPTPPPVFDTGLHVRTLRSNGGLIYRNEDEDSEMNVHPFKVGFLMPLWQDTPDSGVVLCGFSRSHRATGYGFTSDEIKYVKEFGQTLKNIRDGKVRA
ncbi:hypothetical protein YB2330_004917 [Saitoella coloradoensis]